MSHKFTKQNLTIWALLLLSVSTVSLSAKWSYGGEFSFIHFTGESSLRHFGAGIFGEYGMNDLTTLRGSAGYFFPHSYQASVLAFAKSSSTIPYTKEVLVDSRITFTNLAMDCKRYFIGRHEGDENDRFGFFGFAGSGLMIGSRESDIPSFEQSLYTVPIQDEKKGSFINWIVSAGFGAEYLLGSTYLYASFRCSYAFDKANQQYIKTDAPLGFNYNFGMRIPFLIKSE